MGVQNLNILMLGAQNGKGGFFPKGIQGKINTPVGFDKLAEATEDWTGKTEAEQVCTLLPHTHTHTHLDTYAPPAPTDTASARLLAGWLRTSE